MPDEIALGFLGRIRILNGWATAAETLAALHRSFGIPNDQGKFASQVAILAVAAGATLEQFTKQNTLVPVLRAIVQADHHLPHGNLSNSLILRRSGMGTKGQKSRLCPCCVEEDHHHWGYSYWRRIHQLEGLMWCLKHRQILHEVNSSNAFMRLPADVMDESRPIEWAEPILSNDVLGRYSEIMSGFLDRPSPLLLKHVTQLLRQRCWDLGLRTGERGNRKLLSDVAIELVPDVWLGKFFPKVAQKSPTMYGGSLDRLLNSHNPLATSGYALAAALLWPSSDDALTSLTNASNANITGPEKRRAHGKEFWGGDHIFDLYVRFRGMYRKIAQEIGVDKKNVSIQLRRHGLPSLGCTWHDNMAAAILGCMDGGNIQDMCDIHGVKAQGILPFIKINSPKFIRALTLISESTQSCGFRDREHVAS